MKNIPLGLCSSVVAALVFAVVTLGCRSESEPQPSDAGAKAGTDETAPVAQEISEGQDWTVPGLGMEFVWLADMKCWVGKYEVTNEEYREFKPEHRSKVLKGHSLNGDRQPASYVNYDDAVSFAEWLTQHERQAGRLPEELRYRLPDGDEWTTFAQCGDSRKYPWGNEWPPKDGNYYDRRGAKRQGLQLYFLGKYREPIKGYDDGFPVTCPVEKSGKNDWGLYGVGGNVHEYTSEHSGPQRKGVKYPYLRGASWGDNRPELIRCEYRHRRYPQYRSIAHGFRLLLSR